MKKTNNRSMMAIFLYVAGAISALITAYATYEATMIVVDAVTMEQIALPADIGLVISHMSSAMGQYLFYTIAFFALGYIANKVNTNEEVIVNEVKTVEDFKRDFGSDDQITDDDFKEDITTNTEEQAN